MRKQIKEVVELVNVLTTAVHIAASKYAVEGDTEEVQSLIQCKQKARKNLEAKLLELIPGWQPIESAPTTGEFLVLGGTWEGEINSDNSKQGIHLVEWAGRFDVKGTDGYSAWINNPTHWMPLPKAPE